MSKETGGQAFPISGSENNMPVQGMTLRDYFAGQAMQGGMASGALEIFISSGKLNDYADHCYRIADAMLRARGE